MSFVRVGVVARPHGVRGALKLHLDNPESELLAPGLKLRIVPVPRRERGGVPAAPKDVRDVVVARVFGGDRVELEGDLTREDADALRGAEIQVDRADFPPPSEEEAYLIDFVGAEVRTEGGATLGVIRGFTDNRAQPLALVETPSGAVVEMPFVPGIITHLDPEAAAVIVAPPGGLFDDDALHAGDAPASPEEPDEGDEA